MTLCTCGWKQAILSYPQIPLGLGTSLLWLSRKKKMNLIIQFWLDLMISEKSPQAVIGSERTNDCGKPRLIHLFPFLSTPFQLKLSHFWSSSLLTARSKYLMLNPCSTLYCISSFVAFSYWASTVRPHWVRAVEISKAHQILSRLKAFIWKGAKFSTHCK